MGFWSADSNYSPKRIAHRDLDNHFDKIRGLTSHERQYLLGKFDHYKDRHITKQEALDVIRDLKNNREDGIEHHKAEALHEILMDHYDSTDKEDDVKPA